MRGADPIRPDRRVSAPAIAGAVSSFPHDAEYARTLVAAHPSAAFYVDFPDFSWWHLEPSATFAPPQ